MMHDDPFVIRKTCMTGECLSLCSENMCDIFSFSRSSIISNFNVHKH